MEADTTNSGSKNETKAARLRHPLPGNEVEAATVTAEIGRLVEVVCADRDSAIESATNPRLPGVFSDALHERLCKLERDARTAAALMRRLRVLCGDTRPERVRDLEREAAGGWSLVELVKDATFEEYRFAERAIEGARRLRRERAGAVDGCPLCGGITSGCTPTGRCVPFIGRSPQQAPARMCNDCGTITANKQAIRAPRKPPARAGERPMKRADQEVAGRLARFVRRITQITPEAQDTLFALIDEKLTRAERGCLYEFSAQSLAAAAWIDGFNERTRIRLWEALRRLAEAYAADPSSRRAEPTPARDLGAGVIDLQARRGR